MKKVCFVSIVMALMLLVASACAERGYMTMQAALSNELVMGQPVCLPSVSAPENAMLIINVPEHKVLLGGLNAENQPEVTAWCQVDLQKQLGILTYCCGSFDVLNDWSANGPMTIALRLVPDQENCYFIRTGSVASACYDVLNRLLLKK